MRVLATWGLWQNHEATVLMVFPICVKSSLQITNFTGALFHMDLSFYLNWTERRHFKQRNGIWTKIACLKSHTFVVISDIRQQRSFNTAWSKRLKKINQVLIFQAQQAIKFVKHFIGGIMPKWQDRTAWTHQVQYFVASSTVFCNLTLCGMLDNLGIFFCSKFF